MPIYETQDDLKVEAQIAEDVAAYWHGAMRKLPEKYALDFAFMRVGVVRAFVEIKSRPDYSMEQFNSMGGYMLSLLKWERGQALCREAGVRFFLIVRCSDATWYADLTMEDVRRHRVGFFGGYKTPRRESDKEPVIYLRPGVFVRMSLGEEE